MKKAFSLSLLWTILAAANLCAQQTTGTIVGSVLDASGGGVPNVTVTVINTDLNAVIRIAATDASGNYAAPLLPIGHYSVSAEAKGFKKAIQRDIQVNVNDNLTINLTLEVGDIATEVSVQADTVQVELQSSAAGTVIEGSQIRELSLNARNYEQLVALMPGVTFTGTGDQIYVGSQNPLTGQSNAVTFSINGGRTDQNSWTIDGADNVDRGANLTLLSYPSVDSIAEFKVLRGQYSAEYGRNASGMINVITKSGTSTVHATAYEFFRNDALAANNYFNNANRVNLGPDGAAKVPPLRYNNFGYNVGGPVYIPRFYKQRNKTFFFFNEEWRRVITYAAVQGTAPTADEKKGIFSAPVCLQASGSTCLNSSTTITNIDPVAQAYIKDIFSQVPDAPASHLINLALRNVTNFREEIVKIDHVFSSRWSVQGRFVNDSIPTIEPRGIFTGASLPGVSNTSSNSPGKGFNFRLTGTINPSLINEVGYSYSYGAIISDPTGLDASANSPDINLKLPYAVTLGRIPTINFGGVSSVTGYGPYRDYNRNHNWFDNLTLLRGRHTIKFGVSLNRYEKVENTPTNNVGTFTFSSTARPTGSAATTTMQGWANFLLGNFSQFTQTARDITPDIHANEGEMYVQDDIRVRRNLTVNAGVRYSLFRQPYDSNGYLNTFDPKYYDPSKAPQVDASGNLVPGTGDPLNGFIIGGKNSPFGSKIAPEKYLNFAPRFGFSWDPFGKGKTAVRSGYGIVHDVPAIGRYEDPVMLNPASLQSITVLNSSFASITSGTAPVAAPPAITAIGTNYQTPYTQQWSLDIQHELPGRFLIDVGYFGSKGTHLWGEPDLNELRPGQAVALGITDPNTPLVTSTDPKVNAYRPYRGYRAINVYETWFNSNYNSLQFMAKKAFARNGFVTTSYTWSKTLTNAGSNAATPQNTYDRMAEKGHSPYDRNHVLTASWSYEIPFFLKSGTLLRSTLGGWQYSGILSVASGLWSSNPSTSSLATDPAGLGILSSGSGATPRADFICDPNKDAPHTLLQWFNTGCLTDVPKGQLRPGNAPRNGIRGPGYQKWDMSIFKNVHFTEHTYMQLRLESFNTFNHTNWSTIGATLGSSTYGQITGARDPRIVQLGVKLYY